MQSQVGPRRASCDHCVYVIREWILQIVYLPLGLAAECFRVDEMAKHAQAHMLIHRQ